MHRLQRLTRGELRRAAATGRSGCTNMATHFGIDTARSLTLPPQMYRGFRPRSRLFISFPRNQRATVSRPSPRWRTRPRLENPMKSSPLPRPPILSSRVPTSSRRCPLTFALLLLVALLSVPVPIVAVWRAWGLLPRWKHALHRHLHRARRPSRTASLIALQSVGRPHGSASRSTVKKGHQQAPARVSPCVFWGLVWSSRCHTTRRSAYTPSFRPHRVLELANILPIGDRPLPTASEPILPSAHGVALGSFVARAHENVHGRLRHDSPYKQRPGHSRRTSHTRGTSVESRSHTHSPTGTPPRSPSPSRGVSPLRSFLGRFSPLGRAQSREEPFIPINPFRLHAPLPLNPFARCFGARRRTPDVEAAGPQYDMTCTCACVPFFGSGRFHNLHLLVLDTLPRQLYLHSQLRLPSLYFSRVARIFEDAAVSRPEIQRIIDACELGTENVPSRNGRGVVILPFPEEWVPPNVSPALARFKRSWENFVDSLVREWKTLNVLSALLLSAILTLFQVPDAAIDPLTRTAALCSLISALMSLSFGITYIIRFGTMRSMYRASRWAEEAQKSETAIFWNVWVLLALPGIWLAWSVLAFLVAIMSFVWRTGAEGQSNSALPRKQAFGARIGVTCQLLLGLVYFAFVIRTFRNYGESGRKARVVRRLTDVQIELETRGELERDREREGERNDLFARTRENEDGTRDRGRRRADGSLRQKEKPPTNKLGLSGMDRKPEVTVTAGNGDLPVSDSFSAVGI